MLSVAILASKAFSKRMSATALLSNHFLYFFVCWSRRFRIEWLSKAYLSTCLEIYKQNVITISFEINSDAPLKLKNRSSTHLLHFFLLDLSSCSFSTIFLNLAFLLASPCDSQNQPFRLPDPPGLLPEFGWAPTLDPTRVQNAPGTINELWHLDIYFLYLLRFTQRMHCESQIAFYSNS